LQDLTPVALRRCLHSGGEPARGRAVAWTWVAASARPARRSRLIPAARARGMRRRAGAAGCS